MPIEERPSSRDTRLCDAAVSTLIVNNDTGKLPPFNYNFRRINHRHHCPQLDHPSLKTSGSYVATNAPPIYIDHAKRTRTKFRIESGFGLYLTWCRTWENYTGKLEIKSRIFVMPKYSGYSCS